jgi:fatty-acyl-CoA synthase
MLAVACPSTDEVRYICDHAGAKVLVADTELTRVLEPVAAELTTVEKIVAVDDAGVDSSVPAERYEDFLEHGETEPLPWTVDDEEQAISINYTSGTTGRPKGVMYTHRGAYLNALGEVVHSKHSSDSVYLWTLPMFHCNGWCTTWAVTAVGGRHVCLRAVEPSRVWQLMRDEGVTHLNGAPTVLISLANAPEAAPLGRPLTITTAGAPPSPTIIEQMTELGARIVHVYGLTETYGPASVAVQRPEWDDADISERTRLNGRQGVRYALEEAMTVRDPATMKEVPADGRTMGEIMFRGNIVMKGYLKNEKATLESLAGGWFHTGDLAVLEPDRYVKIRDRSKDVIISGGENISSLEVEDALYRHPAVLACAVVARPDPKWGETPLAFVELRGGAAVSAADLVAHCKSLLAGYKVPREIRFEPIPKTSTGKIQKFQLRERARSNQAIE